MSRTRDVPTPSEGRGAFASRLSNLPPEIKWLLVEAACQDYSRATRGAMPGLDSKTVLSLSLVNREVYHHVRAIQYSNIRITSAGALYALHQTLLARPELGKLIKSLHVGPCDTLSPGWWPLAKAYGPKAGRDDASYTWIMSSLKASQLPSWCQERHAWPVDRLLPTSCRDGAIQQLLEDMQRDLDVNLLSEGHTCSGPYVGTTWMTRVFKSQAALDLWLAAVKRLEDDDPSLAHLAQPNSGFLPKCLFRRCTHFPRLVLEGGDLPATSEGENVLMLTQAQLLRHLARRGATTDRFDHPLHFMRSGYRGRVVTSREVVCYENIQSGRAHYSVGGRRPTGSRHDGAAVQRDQYLYEVARPRDASSFTLTSTATMTLTLEWVRGLLAGATSLENLSLTGYLDEALCGNNSPASLRALRRLSVGPSPHFLNMDKQLPTLDNLEALRACGYILKLREAKKISSGMPKLRRITLNAVTELVGNSLTSLTDFLESLWTVTYAQEEHGGQSQTNHASPRMRVTEPKEMAPSSNSRLVDVILSRVDFKSLLDASHSGDIRQVWSEGIPLPGTSRRLRLVENPAANINRLTSGPDFELAWQAAYDEGEEWWRSVLAPSAPAAEGAGEGGQCEVAVSNEGVGLGRK